MKKIFEKTEDVGFIKQFLKESVREDAEFSKYLVDTYPDLKTLYDMKPGCVTEDNLKSPEKDVSNTGFQLSDQ